MCIVIKLWHYGVCGSGRLSIGLFWRETQTKAWARDLRRDQKKGRKGRSERSQRVSWRRETQRGSRQRRAEESGRLWVDCPENVSQQKSERRLLKPDELHRGRPNQHEKMPALLVPFYRSFAKNTRQRYSTDAQGMQCHKTTFLALGADINPYCSFVLFSPTLSVVFFVAVKKCEIPRRTH